MGEHGPHDGTGGDDTVLEPVLADVLADDRLVESVASGALTAAETSDEVLALLVAWRDEVDAGAVPVHPDLDEAVAALEAARRGRWRVPLRVLSPVAAAAAAVGIALTGIGYAAHQSTPGDPLWGVSQAIFADHSRSVQAAANVTAELAEAETALGSGTPEQARTALLRAAADLTAVDDTEGRQELERRHADLQARLDATAPADAETSTAPAPVTTTAPSASSPTPTSAPTTTTTRPAPSPTREPDPSTTTPTTTAAPSTTTTAPTDPPTTDPSVPPTTTDAPTTLSTPAAVAVPEVVVP